nr:hypothetical protein [Tanacetum cinerariifolium]
VALFLGIGGSGNGCGLLPRGFLSVLLKKEHLDALPPTLFKGYDRDLKELYTKSKTVKDEIFLQRLILALEAWTGKTDAQIAAMWHAIHDIQKENHDLRRQIAEERRERLELTDCVARLERRHEYRGE